MVVRWRRSEAGELPLFRGNSPAPQQAGSLSYLRIQPTGTALDCLAEFCLCSGRPRLDPEARLEAGLPQGRLCFRHGPEVTRGALSNCEEHAKCDACAL